MIACEPISEEGFQRLIDLNNDERDGNYQGGFFTLPNGSKFDLAHGSLTPPPEFTWGDPVTVTMTVEIDTIKNELLFTFGPSGSSFSPPAAITFDWHDLGIEKAALYYIDSSGDYIKQAPETQKSTSSETNDNKNGSLSEEKVELSKRASDLNTIRDIVQKTPDIRAEKVALLREKIASGSYTISSQEIADKMLREYLLEDTL